MPPSDTRSRRAANRTPVIATVAPQVEFAVFASGPRLTKAPSSRPDARECGRESRDPAASAWPCDNHAERFERLGPGSPLRCGRDDGLGGNAMTDLQRRRFLVAAGGGVVAA